MFLSKIPQIRTAAGRSAGRNSKVDNKEGSTSRTQLAAREGSRIGKGVEKSYQEISALGYEFNSAPMVTRENGPKIAFFKGPDNVIIELYQKAE